MPSGVGTIEITTTTRTRAMTATSAMTGTDMAEMIDIALRRRDRRRGVLTTDTARKMEEDTPFVAPLHATTVTLRQTSSPSVRPALASRHCHLPQPHQEDRSSLAEVTAREEVIKDAAHLGSRDPGNNAFRHRSARFCMRLVGRALQSSLKA